MAAALPEGADVDAAVVPDAAHIWDGHVSTNVWPFEV